MTSMLPPARSTLLVIAALLALSACAGRVRMPADVTLCVDPRPEVCTMIYDPVCGVHVDPARPDATYASGCSACADPAVAGYRPGPCPD